ncbi:unnamed protein product [Adineta steineri]|uniref:Uncharacterized protein n=1 Tax=Adineta steineri TaxID=433720 RepID=A0A814MR39_9BILA|nr:unnamed protein product [Adineta steineri]CAF1440003.1 unnamed protein product [Adineta steineri]CAF1442050.1 unnamed protein product [Adineta steineri]
MSAASPPPRRIPVEITGWMQKDISIAKVNDRASLMPPDIKRNAIANRKFFSDLFKISTARYRTINRHEFDKQTFLHHQKVKAESAMPGLLPYIEPSIPNTSRSLTSSRVALNKIDQSVMSSFEPHTSRSVNKQPEILQPIPVKPQSIRQQQSTERINRLAQPRGRPIYNQDHVRSHYIQPITVKDLFGDIEDFSNCNSLLSDRTRTTVGDTRFQQLMDTCSDVHKSEVPTKLHSVENIVRSNTSLQDEEGRWESAASRQPIRTVEVKKHIKKLTKQLSTKTSVHLMDLCTC